MFDNCASAGLSDGESFLVNETTDAVIIRALSALIQEQDREIANLERQLEAERKAAKHLIEGIDAA